MMVVVWWWSQPVFFTSEKYILFIIQFRQINFNMSHKTLFIILVTLATLHSKIVLLLLHSVC